MDHDKRNGKNNWENGCTKIIGGTKCKDYISTLQFQFPTEKVTEKPKSYDNLMKIVVD